MKFIELEIFIPIGSDGDNVRVVKAKVDINPMLVSMIKPVPVPSEIAGPDGKATVRIRAGLEVGGNSVITNEEIEDVKRKIEEALNV